MRFEPKSEKEVAEAGLLANGIYDFEVGEASEAQSKAGNDMVELRVRVYDSEGHWRNVFDWLVSTDGGAYKIRHFAEATGLLTEYEKGELRAEDMKGKVGKCKVFIKKDKDGQYPDKNAIADYINSDGAAPTAANFDRSDLDDEIPF